MKDSKRVTPLLAGLLAALPLSALGVTEVYVPLGSANAIAVVDAETDRVVAEIPTPAPVMVWPCPGRGGCWWREACSNIPKARCLRSRKA